MPFSTDGALDRQLSRRLEGDYNGGRTAPRRSRAMARISWASLIAVLVAITACAPPQARAPEQAATNTEPRESHTLSVVVRNEPFDLTDTASGRNNITVALFVARLVNSDDLDTPQPVLSEGIPELNTDTWRVFPDGKMETTFHLRPNLTWHDGTSLTAEDV